MCGLSIKSLRWSTGFRTDDGISSFTLQDLPGNETRRKPWPSAPAHGLTGPRISSRYLLTVRLWLPSLYMSVHHSINMQTITFLHLSHVLRLSLLSSVESTGPSDGPLSSGILWQTPIRLCGDRRWAQGLFGQRHCVTTAPCWRSFCSCGFSLHKAPSLLMG